MRAVSEIGTMMTATTSTSTHLSLAELIHVFRMQGRTGILQLLMGDEHGSIYVFNGRLIDAATSLAGSRGRMVGATGEDAIRQMLSWCRPTFRFRHDPLLGKRVARISREDERQLQEEICQRGHGLSAMPAHAVTAETILEVAGPAATGGRGVFLGAEGWGVLVRAANGLSLRQIGEELGITEQRLFDVTAELLAMGVVAVATLAAPSERLLRDHALLESFGTQMLATALHAAPSDRLVSDHTILAAFGTQGREGVAA